MSATKKNTSPESQRFSDVLDLINAVVVRIDHKGRIVEFFNKHLLSTLFPDSNSQNVKDIADQLQKALVHALENENLKNGLTLQLKSRSAIRLFLLRIKEHSDGYLILLEDITDQRNFEENLKSSERKFRILLESAAQGILVVDINGQITLANTKIEQLFGYNREELLNQPVEILIPAPYRDVHVRHRSKYILKPFQRMMGEGRMINGQRKDGTQFPIEVSLSSVELHDGMYIMAFITDISERRQLEDRIRRMEKLEAIGQLAGGIAHDFNNVLAGIMGLSELALRKIEENHPAVRHIKLILQKSQDAAFLVKQLLAFSRQQTIAPRRLNLNQIIRNNYDMLQRYLGEDILLKLNLAEHLWPIQADPSAVDQVITNLCINARDAMPDGGELRITTQNIDLKEEPMLEIQAPITTTYVRLTISDTGMGIPKEIQKRIFEPFFTTKEFGHGTGLGLSTVYGLVEQHQGIIKFSSTPGEGTTFYIYLPALIAEESEIHRKEKSDESYPGKETILLVDDESTVLESHKELLEALGYKILTANDGLAAYRLLEKHQEEIDLIVSDVVMPNLGGIDLKILAQRLNPEIRVLLISAYSDKLEPGVPYLQKPFTLEELTRRIREVLEG